MLKTVRTAVFMTGVLSCFVAFCQNDRTGGRMHGVVVGDAKVILKFLPVGRVVATTQTDYSGRFEFSAVTPGRYIVAMEAPGFALQRFGVIVQPGGDLDFGKVVMQREIPCPPSPPSPTPPPGQPIKTTLCEILKEPDRFNGMIVEFRASPDHGFHASLLRDERGAIWLDEAMDLQVPEGLQAMTQVVLKKDGDYEKMNRFLDATYTDAKGIPCRYCPLYKVTVDAVGLFEHVDHLTMGFGQQKDVGFGYLKGHESRLVLQSVSNVEATPIDSSIYERHEQ